MKRESQKNLVRVVLLFVVFCLFGQSAMAQVQQDVTNSNQVVSQLGSIWKWVKVGFSMAFFILIIMGGFDVYQKSQSENKEEFKKALMSWGKGLIFLVVFFAAVSGILLAWSALTNQMLINGN